MKPMTRQLAVAATVLILVTVASLGIRQVRFSIHRAAAVESLAIANTESADSPTVDAEPEPQPAIATEPEQEELVGDYPEIKPSKGEYTKAKGAKKGLQKISLGNNENLYITEKGETWYTGKGPDGNPTKMQVEIDEATGEMTIVGKVYGGKSEGSQGLQKISMGNNENIYITEEGQTWYVGSGSKSRVEIDDATGEITVLEQYGDDGK